MPIQIRCDCGKRLKFKDSAAGKKLKCRECGGAILVSRNASQHSKVPKRSRKSGATRTSSRSRKGPPRGVLIAGGVGVALLIGGVAFYLIWSVVGQDEFGNDPQRDIANSGSSGQSARDGTGGTDQPSVADQPTSNQVRSNQDEQTTPSIGLTRSQAQNLLKLMGATLENDPDLGGLFADFGLIRGEFPGNRLAALKLFPELAAIRLPVGLPEGEIHRLTAFKNLKLVTATGLSDTGLQQLQKLQSVTKLVIFSNKVTPEGVARLKEALPNCEVVVRRDPSDR